MEEGRDGTHRLYRERLWPSAVIVVLALGLATIGGVAYGAAYGAPLGWLVGGLLTAVLVGALVVTSPVVHVDDRVVRAGRARLPLAVVERIEPLDHGAMLSMRRGIDPRAYLLLRPWSARGGILITLDDAHDPHPAWLISSRHPARIVEAVHSARRADDSAPAPNDGPPNRHDAN